MIVDYFETLFKSDSCSTDACLYSIMPSLSGSDNEMSLASFNDTQLILIPKKQQVEVMGDLRPISLCNVIYKIMPKTVANRLKRVFPKVVSSF